MATKTKIEKTEREAIDAEFSKTILDKANAVASAYEIVLRQEDGEWYGHALEYPEAMGDGKTPAAAIKATRKAIVSGVAVLLEMGETPPRPARQQIRDQQVNIRISVEEKALLEARARAQGFRGISDYMRTVSMV